jgi:hypothetical protein
MPPRTRRSATQLSLGYLLIAIFAADMLVSCFVAYFDNGHLVTDLHEIRARYLGGR